MDKISSLFLKYSSFLNNNFLIKEIIVNSIKDVTKITIDKNKISINGNNIKLKLSAVEKSEIFISKIKILEKINKNKNSIIFKDIK